MDLKAAYQLLQGNVVTKKKATKTKVQKPEEENITDFYKRHSIKCYSMTSEIDEPIKSFDEMFKKYPKLADLKKSIESMKYETPSPIQMQSIPTLINNHNLIALAPTGSGKTLAFLIPILYGLLNNKRPLKDSPYAIIVSPTIELCKQISQELLCILNDFNDDNLKDSVQFVHKKTKFIKQNTTIIISTPLKIKKIIDAKKLNLTNLKWLIVDESDKMMDDDGLQSFAVQMNCLYKQCKLSKELKVGLFSATQNDQVWDWAKENLSDDLIYVRVGAKNSAAQNIKQKLRYCISDELKLQEMKSLFNSGDLRCPCLIFLDRALHAQCLYDVLSKCSSAVYAKVGMMSGEMSDVDRRQTILDFRQGKIHFLICTNILSRGIDFKSVATIINYDLPRSSDDYIHRIGRCGRAGENGVAISLWTDADATTGLPGVIKVMKASNQEVNEDLVEHVKQKPRAKYVDKKLKKFKRRFTEGDWESNNIPYEAKRKRLFLEKCTYRGTDLTKHKATKN